MKTEAKFRICGWVGAIIIGTYTALYIIDMFVALTNPVPFWEIMLIAIMALAYACIWILVCRLAEHEWRAWRGAFPPVFHSFPKGNGKE